MLTYGSLFSGGGLLDKGLEDAGMICRWQVEIEPYKHIILRRHFPNAPKGFDILLTDWRKLEPVHLIAFGFPCKDISISRFGSHLGLTGKHSGLFYKAAEIVHGLHPEWILIENVPQVMKLKGAIYDELSDYTIETAVIRASDLGGYTRRERAVFVGHLGGKPESPVFPEPIPVVSTFRSGGYEDILPMCLPWSGGVSLERLGSCVIVPD